MTHLPVAMEGKRIGHYKVLEKIGEGGMGVVYRARDTRLVRDVALKFLSVDFTGSEELKERFVQEAQAASRLDHQNICTIYAIEETDDGRLFIAMGYYSGETIKAKLAGKQPLPEKDIVKIAMQIASGLQVAHAKGIIHLDVKPANLMVKPKKQVKILDFGLSRFTSEIDRTRPQGPLMGTVAYMAPEQVQGESTGPETDIWALGVVMYEMATGLRPFQGKNDMAVLYSIVHRECPAPKELVPELSTELDQIIRRCLFKDRRRRYADTNELLADLEPLRQNSSTLTDTLPIPNDYARRQKRIQLTMVVAVLLASLVVWYLLRREREEHHAEPVDVLLAQLSQPQSTDAVGWRSEALSELLVLKLRSEKVRWIRRGDPDSESILHGLDLSRRSEQGFPESVLLDLRSRNVEWILSGTLETVEQEGEKLLEARLLVQAPGRPAEVLTRSGSPNGLIALATRLAGDLAAFLDVEVPVTSGGDTGWPDNAEAVDLFLQAKEKNLAYETKTSQKLFKKALAKDPEVPLLEIYLADALWQLGHEDLARKAGARAVDTARQLAPTPRLYLDALDLETRYQTQRATHLLRVVWNEGTLDEGPVGSPEVGLRLVLLLVRARQIDAAEEVLESLREKLPNPPVIAFLEGKVARSRHEAQDAFARAAELARQAAMPLLQAQALLQEGQQWERQGIMDKAELPLNAALEIYTREGYKIGEAHALLLLGNVRWVQDLLMARELWAQAGQIYKELGAYRYEARTEGNQGRRLVDQGDYLAGIEALQRAQNIYEERLRDRPASAVTLPNLGEALIVTGQFDKASKALEKALEVFGEAEPVPRSEAIARTYLGWLSALKGDLGAADRSFAQAISLVKDSGDEASVAEASYYRSLVLRLQGDSKAAIEACRQALTLTEQTEDSTTHARALAALGELHMIRDELADAEGAFREALDTLDTLANPLWAAQTRISLASLLIERGQPGEAERQTRVAVGEISQRSAVLDVSAGYVVLARSLLAQGNAAAAGEAVESARQHLGDIPSPLYRIPLEVTEARINAALGHRTGSVKKLDTLLGAESWGLPIALELEILLAMGEIELQSGQGRSRRLKSVAQLAAQKGFELIRRKAEQANSSN